MACKLPIEPAGSLHVLDGAELAMPEFHAKWTMPDGVFFRSHRGNGRMSEGYATECESESSGSGPLDTALLRKQCSVSHGITLRYRTAMQIRLRVSSDDRSKMTTDGPRDGEALLSSSRAQKD